MPRIEIQLPEDVTAEVDGLELAVSGPNGSVERRLWYPDVTVEVEDAAVTIESDADDAVRDCTLRFGDATRRLQLRAVPAGLDKNLLEHIQLIIKIAYA